MKTITTCTVLALLSGCATTNYKFGERCWMRDHDNNLFGTAIRDCKENTAPPVIVLDRLRPKTLHDLKMEEDGRFCNAPAAAREAFRRYNPKYEASKAKALTQEEVAAYAREQGGTRVGDVCYAFRTRRGFVEPVQIPCGQPQEDWRDISALAALMPPLTPGCEEYEKWYIENDYDGDFENWTLPPK